MRLHAVCKTPPNMAMVTEMCTGGDLENAVHNATDEEDIPWSWCVSMALQTAKAMAHVLLWCRSP